MNKGFVILAQNTKEVNYVECAEVLATSIKRVMPDANVTLISDNISMCNHFDNVVELPYGDLAPSSTWKLINDWQVYEASPYEYTIKLEADMYIPESIDYWWDVLKDRDVVVSSTVRNFKNEISNSKYYRQFIVDNNLPDVYNAITYFKKSDGANFFFSLVRDIFQNWEEYKAILQCNNNEECTTDWAYSIACHIMGVEQTTLPIFTQMSMIHMKPMINELLFDDWRQELVYEFYDRLKVVSHVQRYPFHYHIKNFSQELRIVYG